ncbi:MAG TPA: hypothetical protein VES20_15930, partial [Bryobacteraceae bacterium]|nr:hypothetical protein [Bryobacteraceae bacterium]
MPGPARLVFLSWLVLLSPAALLAAQPVLLIGDEPGSWSKIFASVGITVAQANHIPLPALRAQVQSGAFVIVEGENEFATVLGFRAGQRKIPTRSLIDARHPKLSIVWQESVEIPEFSVPSGAQVFARERWTGAPLLAGLRDGKGAVLWLATKPGPRGYERYPYVLQALVELGLQVRLRSNRLWAFLDSSYRTRADLDYVADSWARAGISALHVAAWHFFEPDPARDEWLNRLTEACHKRGILLYAWVELPHVSDQFWREHPQWREKTALGQDAHLDWRKLMNLQDRDCFRAVEKGLRNLLQRFDWDGVNLAELYFESLEGVDNAARFTPMNDTIRNEYRALTEVDPVTLLRPGADPQQVGTFLSYR